MELNAEHVIVIGIVASVMIQAVKFLGAWFGWQFDRKLVMVVMYVIALIMAYIFARPVMPAWPVPVEDPAVYAGMILTFFGQLIALASAISGFAVLIYNILLKQVFEKLGLDDNIPDLPPEGVG
jgi:hypothetical protein